MNPGAPRPPWQPLTFGGVAAFAGGSLRRLLQAQGVVALLTSSSFLWFLSTAWLPALEEALDKLPPEAGVRDAQLAWANSAPVILGQTPFLAISVNPVEAVSPGATADFELLFTPRSVRLRSLLGYWDFPYWEGWRMDLSQPRAAAWWSAWRRPLFLSCFLLTLTGSLLAGWLTGLLAAAPVRWVAALLRREITRRGAWQLAVAALSPGALLFAAALTLYSSQRLSLVGLGLAWIVHCLFAPLYLILSPIALPRITQRRGKRTNPFDTSGSSRPKRKTNPFKER